MILRTDDTDTVQRRKHRVFFVRLLESLPLFVFLIVLAIARPTNTQGWRAIYLVCGLLALLAAWATRATGAIANRLHMAIGLYFISGAVALFANWHTVNQWYARVEAAAMLCWVVAVGVVTCSWSARGFAGLTTGTRTSRRYASVLLLMIALAATALSFATVGQPLWNAYLPFATLFMTQALLRARFSRASNHND
jgi:hypothetical protein